MREFFRGWRSKAGVVTLVMALALTAVWVRSNIFEDHISGPFSKGDNAYRLEILSVNQQAGIVMMRSAFPQPNTTSFGWGTRPLRTITDIRGNDLNWWWNWYGFHMVNIRPVGGISYEGWLLPYWSIVIPLTALSVFLLLFRPRQSTPKKITEPVPSEGA